MYPPQRILAFAPNWLGDAVMATPALRALARVATGGRVAVAARPGICRLLDGLPCLERLHALPKASSPQAMLRAAGPLRRFGYDAAAVFPHSFRAALMARLSGAKRRAGQRRNGRSWLLTDTVEPRRVDGKIEPVYMTDEYLAVGQLLGATDDGRGLELAADERLLEEARSRRDLARPLVAIAPGAAFGPSKRWLPERYAAVADRLAGDCAAQWTLLTGPGEEDTRDAVLTAAQTQPIALHDGASSIATLKASLAAADLLIGNDSGPRHVAVAFGTPVICVMGPTRPVYSTGPYEKGELLRIDVDCGPCQKPVCETDHRCMTRITAQAVCEAAKRWLPA